MKLLTVTAYYPGHGGGIELVAQALVSRFASNGHYVEWIASATDEAPTALSNQSLLPMPTYNLVERITQLPYPLWGPTSVVTLWGAVGRAELVHVHEHLYFGSILTVLLGRLRGKPIIVTQHMGALGVGSPTLNLLYSLGSRVIARMIFAATSRVVFISDRVRTFFRLDHSNKARLIFNGVETAQFRHLSPAARQQVRMDLGIPDGRAVVLFVGRFVRKKGLHIIHALTRCFPQVLFLFVGSGPEDPSSWPEANIQVAGRIVHDRLSRYYQAADVLLLPSSGEGLPLVVQEALACGLGVLSTDEVAGACPDATTMLRSRPTPRRDADIAGWERALRDVLADGAYIDDREARAIRAQSLWSWSSCASHYECLFQELISANH